MAGERSAKSGGNMTATMSSWLTDKVNMAKLTAQEETAARELFEAYDYDACGAIHVQALRDLLSEANWCMDDDHRNMLIERFCAFDQDIDFDSFLRVYKAMLALQPSAVRKRINDGRIDIADLRRLEADTRTAFKSLGAHDTGYLNMDKMKEVLRELGFPDTDGDDYANVVQEQAKLLDANQDGWISFEEFIRYRSAVIDRYLAQQEADLHQEPGLPGDPWSWEHFAH